MPPTPEELAEAEKKAEKARLESEKRVAELEAAIIKEIAASKITSPIKKAIKKGELFLLFSQENTGSFNDPTGRGRPWRNSYPMTALSVMALASGGHKPTDQSREGQAMSKGLDFILREDLRRSRAQGYFGVDNSRMYGHGITTLCLAKMMALGVRKEQEAPIREATTKAVDLILISQKANKRNPAHRGGWRYEPTSGDSDLSVTVWQLMALRSAKNAGVRVPKDAIDMAVRYLKRSYYSPRNARGEPINMRSGCGYMPGQGPRYSTAAAGLLALQVCGEFDAPEARGTANWLVNQRVNSKETWFYYGTYYYSQGMHNRMGNDPNSAGSKQARLARDNVERIMLNLQKANGAWEGNAGLEVGAGRIYCTSLALISLNSSTGRNPLNFKMLRQKEMNPKRKTTP